MATGGIDRSSADWLATRDETLCSAVSSSLTMPRTTLAMELSMLSIWTSRSWMGG